jgi:cell division inhibitor SepF
MATMFRKAMLYLGLGPEEEYEDYDQVHDDYASQDAVTRHRLGAGLPPTPPPMAPDEPSAIGIVRPISAPRSSSPMTESSSVTVQPSGASSVMTRPRPQVVRPIAVTPNAKPHVVVPTSFNQAQEVADKFKGNQPVIVNLQAADRDLARRLIDFASGLCYGLAGQMEKVANQVYLLTPSNVEVSAEERRRLQERGYDG